MIFPDYQLRDILKVAREAIKAYRDRTEVMRDKSC